MPARTTLDLPHPLGPTNVTSRAPLPTRPSTSAINRSRPKKSSASASSKACSPLNGFTSAVAAGLGPDRGRRLETSVVQQDLLLESDEFRGRFDPELLPDPVAEPLEGAQRLRLASGPVQGVHQLGHRTLAQWVRLHQHLQLSDDLVGQPAPQFRIDAGLLGVEA